MPVQVIAQPTPNPLAMKFTLDRSVVEGRSQSYNSPQEAEGSALAKRLFGVPGVVAVFMVASFVTVRKAPEAEWQGIVPQVEAALQQHFA